MISIITLYYTYIQDDPINRDNLEAPLKEKYKGTGDESLEKLVTMEACSGEQWPFTVKAYY